MMNMTRGTYKCYVFQPDERGIWIHKVTGNAAGCRQFLSVVKKRFPYAFYKSKYSPTLPDPVSISYMDGGDDLFKIENYYIAFFKGGSLNAI